MSLTSNTRRPFTRPGVEVLNPNQNGIYAIYNSSAWVYVGRGDIRSRLLVHLNDPNIMRHRPTHYVAEVTQNDVALEKHYIVQLQPVANKKVG